MQVSQSSAPDGQLVSRGRRLGLERDVQGDGTELLIVGGELDVETAPELQRALAEAAARKASVVLDLANLEFIDSSGIGVLVRAELQATRDGRRLLLRNIPPQAARILSIAGLASRFTVIQDGAGGLESTQSGAR